MAVKFFLCCSAQNVAESSLRVFHIKPSSRLTLKIRSYCCCTLDLRKVWCNQVEISCLSCLKLVMQEYAVTSNWALPCSVSSSQSDSRAAVNDSNSAAYWVTVHQLSLLLAVLTIVGPPFRKLEQREKKKFNQQTVHITVPTDPLLLSVYSLFKSL